MENPVRRFNIPRSSGDEVEREHVVTAQRVEAVRRIAACCERRRQYLPESAAQASSWQKFVALPPRANPGGPVLGESALTAGGSARASW